MSVTMDSLDIQIRSSAGTAAANIDRLADSLKRLRENGKLTVVVNNLQRLSTALSRLQVTSAGLNSILNSLNKLPAIVKSEKVKSTSFFRNLSILCAGEGFEPSRLRRFARD